MREIKFRGKTAYGNWVIGSLIINNFENYFIESYNKTGIRNTVLVIPETVGQFTGLLDENGKKIYEGDVAQMWLEDSVESNGGLWHRMYVVFTIEKGFVLWGEHMTIEYAEPLHEMWQWKQCEIIGNIHDNPELLK